MPILPIGSSWACADEYVRQHGFDAPLHAAMRADELDARCDLVGARNWRLIVERIGQLLAQPSSQAVQ